MIRFRAFSLISAVRVQQIEHPVNGASLDKNPPDRLRLRSISFLLFLVTLAVFSPVQNYEFTNYDDDQYVFDNPAVRNGLNPASIQWALTTTWFSYWHPLTWMSHMLDCTLFGLKAGAHHLMSVLLHALTAVCLFLAFRRMTGVIHGSAVVAGLFALHPMHVESVAWVAERKDILSTLFWVLGLWAYTLYAARPKTGTYLLTLGLYLAALMSKPMVVTFPFVLMLLDYWPLQRFCLGRQNLSSREGAPRLPTTQPIRNLLAEKIPFLVLTALSVFITYSGTMRAGNVVASEILPWSFRLANVPVSYARYLTKLFLPENMTVLYPIPVPPQWELWRVAGALILVLLISGLVAHRARSHPYLLIGWLWFLGTLVPTLSLVAVGFQSLADRYTYLPYIGLFLMLVWGAGDLTRSWRYREVILRTATVIVLLLCVVGTRLQLRFWQNSLTLWTRCIAVTRDNAIAHFQLGFAYQQSNRINEALEQYRTALRINPKHINANLNLGVIYFGLGRYQEATNYFARTLAIAPAYPKAQLNMGIALWQLKDFIQATNYFSQALIKNTNHADLYFYYTAALFDLGDFANAATQAESALRLDPGHVRAHTWLAKSLSEQKRFAKADEHFQSALRLDPSFSPAYFGLGLSLLKRGEIDLAVVPLEFALKQNQDSAEAHYYLAVAQSAQGKVGEAIDKYRKCLRLTADWPEAQNNLAWLLATHPAAQWRNGLEALALAERACVLTQYRQPLFIGTLAAAHAESGDFERAIQFAARARDLAQTLGLTDLADKNGLLLDHFKERKPWRSDNTGSWTEQKAASPPLSR